MLVTNGKRTVSTNSKTYEALYKAKGFKPVGGTAKAKTDPPTIDPPTTTTPTADPKTGVTPTPDKE